MRATLALLAFFVFAFPAESQECSFSGDLRTARATRAYRLEQQTFDQGLRLRCLAPKPEECEWCRGLETLVEAEVLMSGSEVRFYISSISCPVSPRPEINHCNLSGTLLPAEESEIESFYLLFRPLGQELLPVFCSELINDQCEACLKEDVKIEGTALQLVDNYYFSVTSIDC